MGINKKIGQINRTIGHAKESMKFEESERNNKTTTCRDKYKQTSSAYDITGKKKYFEHVWK